LSNASTIRRQISGTQQLTIAPITNPGTAVTNFVLNNNGLTLTGGGVIPLSAGVTGLYAGTGQVLQIRATGTFSGVTATTTTIQIQLWEVPAAVLSAGGLTQTSQTGFNVVSNPAAVVVANATGAFSLITEVQLDAAGNLNGEFSGWIDDGTAIPVMKIATVTGLVGEADLNFVVTATLGGAEPTTSVLTLAEFALDYI
jgi:hypothetical protein